MTLFDGSFPFYPKSKASFPFDTAWAVIISVFITVLATFIIIWPGIQGKGRSFWILRVVTSLFIGAVILTVNFTRDWETGWVTVNTSYKSFSNAVVDANIGLHIGLAGINVTLVGNPVNQINETISYNEHFSWSFGEDYDLSYSEGLERGLPRPILYVAEKFTPNSPCGVHAQYRISSHYASLTLWAAFCTWLISNMFFSMPILLYGGYIFILTALLMICSLLFFTVARHFPMCNIRFGSASLQIGYGASFWLTLATGLLCFLLGLAVILMNLMQPKKLKLVFNVSEGEGEEEEEQEVGPAEQTPKGDILMAPLGENCKVTVTDL
ncbi:dual oxidase maturation factor 1 [Alligator sinensis]|uniref:Dual oxidase maturation factor 1 n=1 Tax=Alligator sinensis TaxID=38654 RepID=A0A1U7RU58_ALLSI|nr:dual oxidase maturation factor 1 [Alligator sinensis]